MAELNESTTVQTAPMGEPVTEPVNEPVSEPTSEPTQEPVRDGEPSEEWPELPEDGVAIDKDGELHFGDNFFGELGRDIEPEIQSAQSEKQTTETPPVFYTPDEVAKTHYSQLDENRLPEAVRPYLPAVKQRLAYLEGELAKYQQQAQAQSAVNTNELVNQLRLGAPKPYTPEESAKLARDLTAQQLGLSDPDEMDFYDPKVLAAYTTNVNNLNQQRSAEIQEYGRQAQGQVNLTAFYQAMAGRPEAQEFDQYLTQAFAAKGVTPTMMQNYITKSGKYAEAYQAVANVYRNFMEQRQAQGQVQSTQPNGASSAKQKQRAKVPFIESAGSGGASARRGKRDLTNLSIMSDEEQAQVFAEMGLF